MTDREYKIFEVIGYITSWVVTTFVILICIAGIILSYGMTLVNWHEKFYGIGENKILCEEKMEYVVLEEKTDYYSKDLGSYDGRPLYSVMKDMDISIVGK